MNINKKVAIVQSCYIPWKGYFDLIHSVDEFILLDEVQYTRRDWRNRNKIKTPQGVIWLTIPVKVKGKYTQKISETEVVDWEWCKVHWKTIEQNYRKAPFFQMYGSSFEQLYLTLKEKRLSQINFQFLVLICGFLGIKSKLSFSGDYQLTEGKTERLLELCKQAGANHYLSGPSAKSYLKEDLFHKEGISVSYMDYSGYPEYSQLYPPFDHQVSVLDLLFSEGPESFKYMKSF